MSSIKKITFVFLFIEKLFDNNFNILRKKGKKKKKNWSFAKLISNCTNFHDYFKLGLY